MAISIDHDHCFMDSTHTLTHYQMAISIDHDHCFMDSTHTLTHFAKIIHFINY